MYSDGVKTFWRSDQSSVWKWTT